MVPGPQNLHRGEYKSAHRQVRDCGVPFLVPHVVVKMAYGNGIKQSPARLGLPHGYFWPEGLGRSLLINELWISSL
jgi:hypothetical protein